MITRRQFQLGLGTALIATGVSGGPKSARASTANQRLLDEIKRRGLLDQIESAPQLLDIAARSIRTTLELNPADAQAHGTGQERTAMLLLGFAEGAVSCAG